MHIYQIGRTTVTLDVPDGGYRVAPGGAISPFERDSLPDDISSCDSLPVVLRPGDIAALAAGPAPNGLSCRPDGLNALRTTPDGPVLLSGIGQIGYALAVFPDQIRETGRIDALFDPRAGEIPPLTGGNLLARLSLHRALLTRDRPVLHASYVDISQIGILPPGERGCILFTAPSGTGKSTQAALWDRYAGAETVNGDRVLLSFGDDGGLWAHGYPACGSSEICLDRTLPVRAILRLAQGPENVLTRMPIAAAARALFAATLQYRWDPWEAERAMELAVRAASAVPVLHLSCRPDRGAVDVVREFLER